MVDVVTYQRVPEMPGLVLGNGHFSDHNFGKHYHLDYHIGLVSSGVQKQAVRGKTQALGPGNLSIMPPGEMHDGMSRGSEAYVLNTFRIPDAWIRESFNEISGLASEPRIAPSVIENPRLAQHFLAFHRALANAQPLTALALQERWLILMSRLFMQLKATGATGLASGLSPRHLNQVREFCQAHIAEKIILDDLAQLCGLSRFQFLRHFERAVGMTPHAWLVRLRLEYACTLLSRSRENLAHVAAQVGFYDQSHFNRAFRLTYGVSPSHY